jgi:cytochrome c oxidase cbb3-type subunit 4
METYSFLRELADSWGLLAMTLLFLGVMLWAFRPAAAACTKTSPIRSSATSASRPAEASQPDRKEA